MFVIDVSQARDIFSMQHIRNIRVFRRQRIYHIQDNVGLRHTLNYTLITLGHNC
jgi:hypothetical protein